MSFLPLWPLTAAQIAEIAARSEGDAASRWVLASDAGAVERERDEARADAARWKAEAERLREAITRLDRYSDTDNDGQAYLATATRDWRAFAADLEAARAALSAGGGTDE